MDHQNIFWTAEGEVVIEIAEKYLILTRLEAENLFTDLGHTLHDMDVSNKSTNKELANV
jgi:hypothetical protein|tara:strand:+ start:272 stop:448 length:177 start_codon:yes stop_codon:yes gene_type:complete